MKLKTLKDLKRFARADNISKFKHPQNRRIKGSDVTILEYREVQALAIKWVKDCPCDDLGDPCPACERTIEMNNITEEDLR